MLEAGGERAPGDVHQGAIAPTWAAQESRNVGVILMPALSAFHARYPELQIHMGVSDRTIDLIGESVDCVVRGGDLADQSLRARHVGDLQRGLYAVPAYLARTPAPLRPAELENSEHRIVGFLWGRTGKT